METSGKTFLTSTEEHLVAIKRRMAARPQTAVNLNRPTSSSLSVRRIDYYTPSISSFGKEAPKYTIPSSRRDLKPLMNNPGPGAYNPPIEPQMNLKMKSRFPMAQKAVEEPNLTMNIEFINRPVFPNNRASTIGSRTEQPFFYINDSPGPSYVPQSTLSVQAHKITNRINLTKIEDVPGPGKYEPKNPGVNKAPAYSVQGPKKRDEWMTIQKNPAPTDYSPKVKVTMKKEPQWTIGKKSRRSKRRKNPNPPKSRFIALENFVIPLGIEADAEEEKKYIDEHPAVRKIVQEIMELVRKERPDQPLDLIRKHFEQFKTPISSTARRKPYKIY
ncbi:hypothetical protein TRFO_39076 [Tritrichomonas foetus]|uniref:Uncharacterized protein n=1 Tax=Tritrichomonas foetus TaxID=1144522 RepID=A0A1J4J901_9EUKA|nr:hypothetical protein TRFO_39076 [Tritrichomonas foetus]|eukprot:OHS94727.1 hypothetical protein TRFO_39076 [Tritrichomonas foetus]